MWQDIAIRQRGPTDTEIIAAFDRIEWPRKETVAMLSTGWQRSIAEQVWEEVTINPNSPRLNHLRRILAEWPRA